VAYVEVKAKTVEMAIEAAMRELGVPERDSLDIEVLQEPERGFLGFGGQDAIVKVAEKEGKKPRNRKRSRSKSKAGGKQGTPEGRGNGPGRARRDDKPDRPKAGNAAKPKREHDDRTPLDVSGQEPLVRDFLQGLLGALGLEGDVETRVEDDVIVANVVGDQTEALVGPRGSVMEAVHELTKTVLQRSAQDAARVRIDIAGYAERRRQALTIYAGELIEQVLAEGGELMLEPMSASDRKVIHDAVAERSGVRSYSEGEAPGRYVVIATVDESDTTPDQDE
jgi:spoIIIJ-associated protein